MIKLMNKNFCLLFVISLVITLFLFSFSSAQVELPSAGKQFEPIVLTQTCDDCTFVNVTRIKFPDSSEQILNGQMSEPIKGNFNFIFTNTSQLGKYVATTCGNPSGVYACQNYLFKITTTGSDILNTIPIFLLIAGFLLFALAVHKELPIVGFASGILLSIAGVYLIIYGLGVFQDVYTQALAYVSLFIGLIIAFASINEGLT